MSLSKFFWACHRKEQEGEDGDDQVGLRPHGDEGGLGHRPFRADLFFFFFSLDV